MPMRRLTATERMRSTVGAARRPRFRPDQPSHRQFPVSDVTSDLTPKSLVLDLLAVAGDIALATPALAEGGQLMGFKPGAVRVAITRLATENLIASPARGEWKLVTDTPWAEEQARWQHLARLVRPWHGNWWVVTTHQLLRSNRPEWNRHVRALMHRGFREASRDVFLRPDNLAPGFDELKDQLLKLGMHPESLLFRASELSFQPPPTLWQIAEQQRALKAALQAIQALLRKRHAGSLDLRCRRFLEVGRHTTRILNTDPLLPAEIADPAPRNRIAAVLPRFVAAGRTLWLQRLGAIADE